MDWGIRINATDNPATTSPSVGRVVKKLITDGMIKVGLISRLTVQFMWHSNTCSPVWIAIRRFGPNSTEDGSPPTPLGLRIVITLELKSSEGIISIVIQNKKRKKARIPAFPFPI